jgi:hypothetical protein
LLGDDDRGCLLPRCDLGFDFLGGQIAYYGMRAELQNVDLRVAKIESTLQQVANVLVLSARQDERLIAIERRVDRLEQALASRHQ